MSSKTQQMNDVAGGSNRATPAHLAAAIAIALGSFGGTVGAAGLGRLSVASALGQPLQAEVEITSVSADEAASLAARLASPDAFRAAGLQFNSALSGLRMAVQERRGRHFIRISSSSPLNEPFVDLMVELNWASGKFVREYTFLLDPPELRTSRQTVEGGSTSTSRVPSPVATRVGSRPAQPSQDASQGGAGGQDLTQAPSRQPAAATTAESWPAGTDGGSGRLPDRAGDRAGDRPGNRAGESSAGMSASAGGRGGRPATVTIAKGDSLGKIAAAVKPPDATIEQTIVAIHQANRSAFIDNNPNLIRQGRTLSIPDDAAIAAVDANAAQRQLRLASDNFRSYKNRLAGAPRETTVPSGGTTATGSVTGQVEDNATKAGPPDRLELSRSTGVGARQAGAIGSSDAESRIAREAAFAESSGRIAELERNVANLQKMLELKNRSLADLQTQLDQLRTAGLGAAPGAASSPGSQVAPSTSTPSAGSATATPSAAATATGSPGGAGAAPPAGAGAAPPAGPAAGSPPAPLAAQSPTPGTPAGAPPVPAPPVPAPPVPAPSIAATSSSGTPAAATPVAAPAAAAQPAPTPTMLEGVMNSPILLPALGALALLVAFGLWIAMRRRNTDRFEDSLTPVEPYTANSLFGTTSSHPIDTGLGTQPQVTAMSEAALTEVDPIAEADVYIAYGRDAQAEEILNEALRRQPERQSLRLKLMEIYSARKDARSFEAMAREMHAMTDGRNEEWPRVAAMGLALERDNPLYSDGAPQAAAINSSFNRAAAATSMAAASSAAVFARPPLHGATPSTARASSGGALSDRAPPAESYGNDVQHSAFDRRASDDDQADYDPASPLSRSSGEAGFDEPPRFGPAAPGPLSAMPGVELPSLDLDTPPPPAPAPVHNRPEGGFDADIPSFGEERPRTRSFADPIRDSGMSLPPIGLDSESSSPSRTSQVVGPSSGQWQEMASKLDLASAYGEIGDKEGARELLQEVVAGGDASQQQKARELLAAI